MRFLKTCACLFLIIGFTLSSYAQTSSLAITSFTLQNDEPNKILVKWSTADEINVSHFEIVFSKDGNSFVKLGVVQGSGNGKPVNNYSFTIHHVASIGLIGSLPFLIFLLIPSVRNKKLRIAIFTLFALTIIACSKKEEELTELKTYYVKLAQVNNDGSVYMTEPKYITIEVPKK